MAVPVPAQFDITFTAEIVAATTTDLASVQDASMRVTAAAPITVTSFGSGANQYKILQFDADITLTQSTALTLIPPVSRVTVLDDVSIFVSDADGNWKETDRQNAAGQTENRNYYAQILGSPNFGGRLTLVSGQPVMTSDQTAKTVIYYTPHIHDRVSIYDGSLFNSQSFAEMSVTLDATNAVNAKAYDLFVAFDGATLRLGYGPAWTSGTARSAAISRLNGIWVNTASITLRYDSTHTFTAAASCASYVGTFYTTAAGQTGMKFLPTRASGGTNNFLALYNAYSQILTIGRSRATSWSYSGASWRMADNSASHRVSWLDGLGVSTIECAYKCYIGSVYGAIGLLLDATSGTPTVGLRANPALFSPSLGFHYVQAMELTDGTLTSFGGGNPDDSYIEARLMM